MNVHPSVRGLLLAALLATGVACTTTANLPLLSSTGLPAETGAGSREQSRAGTRDQRADSASSSISRGTRSTGALPQAAPAADGEALGDRTRASEFALTDDRSSGELRFQNGDAVKVSVWGYPELDHTGTIQPNGKLTLPLVGEIDAAGASAAELRQRIFDRLEPFTRSNSFDLRPGDTLIIDVWQHNELRATSIVDPSGFATFPLAGRLQAAGRPVESIRKEAEQRLLEYMRDARVTMLPTYNNRRIVYDRYVSVLATTLQARRVALLGEVGAPGMLEIRGSLRVVEALAQAQMQQKTAEMNSIVVIRNSSAGAPQYRVIRMTDYFQGRAPDQNIFLQHGDIVVVPKTTIAKVGDFVDLFFSRTLPVFTWWSAMFQSSAAPESAQTTRLINEALRRSLSGVSVNPAR